MGYYIKVTGYIHSDELDADLLDADHESGVSSAGYMSLVQSIGLDDLEFVKED